MPRILAATDGSTSAVPGVWSSTRPPWFDTTITRAPADKAASASSTDMTPLTTKGSEVEDASSDSSATLFRNTGWPCAFIA